MSYLFEIGRVLRTTFSEFSADNCTRMAAALSYYTVFSMPALMVIVVSVAGYFFEPEDVRGKVRREIRSVVGENGAEQVETMIEHANRPGRGVLGTIGGLAFLVFGATGVMGQLQAALNEAWDIRGAPNRSFIRFFFVKRLISLGMILGVAFVLVVSLVMNTVIAAVGDQVTGFLPEGTSQLGLSVGNAILAYLLVTLMFAVMYKFLPDAEVPWSGVWLGAAVTAFLFTAGKWLLGLYLARSDIASTYGAAGSLALILVWVYYSGIIFLFGAEFTQAWTRRNGERVSAEPGAERVAAARN